MEYDAGHVTVSRQLFVSRCCVWASFYRAIQVTGPLDISSYMEKTSSAATAKSDSQSQSSKNPKAPPDESNTRLTMQA